VASLPEPELAFIAVSGLPAPGAPAGAVFAGDFSPPTLNDLGDVAFSGRMIVGAGGVTESTDLAVWGPDATGELSLLARAGFQAPGTPHGTVFFDAFVWPVLNETGQVAFGAGLRAGAGSGTSYGTGFWASRVGWGLRLIARDGDPAPGTPPGAVFDSVIGGLLNDAGGVAFEGELRVGVGGVEDSNDHGFWVLTSNGTPSFVIREGFQAPGESDGVVFDDFAWPASLNDSGEIALFAVLQPGSGGVDSTNRAALVGPDGAGGHVVLARSGSQAPGTPPGTVFDFAEFPIGGPNQTGEFAFQGRLQPGTGDATAANSRGVWRANRGSLELIAREGDAAPGGLPGAIVTHVFRSRPVLNEAGEIFFRARILLATQEQVTGIWGFDRSGNLRFVAGSTTSIPDDPVWWIDPREVSANDRGDVLVEAILLRASAGNVIFLGQPALVMIGRDGEVVTVFRQGDQIEVAPGDERTVEEIDIADPGGQGRRALNNRRQATFIVRFSDDSEAVVLASFQQTIAIDIKPGIEPNRIDPTAPGMIPVAILGSDSFDVQEIDRASLEFGRGRASPALPLATAWMWRASRRDVNRDGFDDLIAMFRTPDAGIPVGANHACLAGEMQDGHVFEGCDSIDTLEGCGRGFELALALPPLIGLRRRAAKGRVG
jgi:hypothetical protein